MLDPDRFRVWAWHRDVPLPSDRRAQGPPEYTRDVPRERQLGLHVIGTFGVSLGILAIRCSRKGGQLTPEMIQIADTPTPPLEEDEIEPAQSNPRRVADDG